MRGKTTRHYFRPAIKSPGSSRVTRNYCSVNFNVIINTCGNLFGFVYDIEDSG